MDLKSIGQNHHFFIIDWQRCTVPSGCQVGRLLVRDVHELADDFGGVAGHQHVFLHRLEHHRPGCHARPSPHLDVPCMPEAAPQSATFPLPRRGAAAARGIKGTQFNMSNAIHIMYCILLTASSSHMALGLYGVYWSPPVLRSTVLRRDCTAQILTRTPGNKRPMGPPTRLS